MDRQIRTSIKSVERERVRSMKAESVNRQRLFLPLSSFDAFGCWITWTVLYISFAHNHFYIGKEPPFWSSIDSSEYSNRNRNFITRFHFITGLRSSTGLALLLPGRAHPIFDKSLINEIERAKSTRFIIIDLLSASTRAGKTKNDTLINVVGSRKKKFFFFLLAEGPMTISREIPSQCCR